MISPHIFCDGVKRAHGSNKCSQAFGRPAHHSVGSSCSCKLQGSGILYAKIMIGHQLPMRQVINLEHPYPQVVWCWRAGNVENSQLINCLGPLPSQIHLSCQLSVVDGTDGLQPCCPFGVSPEVTVIPLEPSQHIITRVRFISCETMFQYFEFGGHLLPFLPFSLLFLAEFLLFHSCPIHVGSVALFTFLGRRGSW